MPSLSRLSASLQYRSAMRGQMMGTRMFTATQMKREEDSHETYANEPRVANIKRAGKEEYISWERFHQLHKDVGILKVKMDTVQGSVKEVNTGVKGVAKKVDRLLYFIIGGFILQGGFDLFRDERNWKRSKEN